MILLLAILTGLLYWADLGEVFAAIGGIPPLILLGALLIATADRFMMALKWSQLVRAAGGPMGLMQAVRIYYQAGFTSMVLPTQLGPDLLRVYLGKRLGISSGLLVASMTVEKVIAVLAGAFLAAAGLVYLGARLPADTRVEMWLGVDIGVALTGLALLLFLFAPFHRFVGGFLRNRVHSAGIFVPEAAFLVGARLPRPSGSPGREPRADARGEPGGSPTHARSGAGGGRHAAAPSVSRYARRRELHPSHRGVRGELGSRGSAHGGHVRAARVGSQSRGRPRLHDIRRCDGCRDTRRLPSHAQRHRVAWRFHLRRGAA